jgi:hypothetical protein
MNYSNNDARVKSRPTLSRAFLRKLQRIREASKNARSLAEKKRLVA